MKRYHILIVVVLLAVVALVLLRPKCVKPPVVPPPTDSIAETTKPAPVVGKGKGKTQVVIEIRRDSTSRRDTVLLDIPYYPNKPWHDEIVVRDPDSAVERVSIIYHRPPIVGISYGVSVTAGASTSKDSLGDVDLSAGLALDVIQVWKFRVGAIGIAAFDPSTFSYEGVFVGPQISYQLNDHARITAGATTQAGNWDNYGAFLGVSLKVW